MPADIVQEIIALLYDTVDEQLQLVIDGEITSQQCIENINTQLTLILSSQR